MINMPAPQHHATVLVPILILSTQPSSMLLLLPLLLWIVPPPTEACDAHCFTSVTLASRF
uniref:Uncharacterized protein n=1 Tax=Phakopsora pachyrhizi TaxID=170000 RepID=A0A0S1MKL7_PHAPC